MVLAIDDVHMEFDSLVRTRKALNRFLDEDLRPEDQVALVTTSGASALSQEFTSDRAVLQQTLSRLNAQGRHAEWSGVPHISDYQAELIEGGDPIALDAAVQEILQSGILQDADSAEQEARGKARAVFAESVYNARLTLEALESLCRGLSGLTGRKALFLVSDGFLTGLTARQRPGLRHAPHRRRGHPSRGRHLRPRHARPRGVGARGQRREPPARGPRHLRSIEAMRQRSEEATRDAMNALAADTGGFLVDEFERPPRGAAPDPEGHRDLLRAGLRAHEHETRRRVPPDRGAPAEPTRPAGADAFRLLRPRRAPRGCDERDDAGPGPSGRAAPGGDANGPRLARSAHGDPRPSLRGLREPGPRA